MTSVDFRIRLLIEKDLKRRLSMFQSRPAENSLPTRIVVKMISQVTGWDPPYRSGRAEFIERYYSAYVVPDLQRQIEKDHRAAMEKKTKIRGASVQEPVVLIRQKFSPAAFSRRPDFYETPEWRAIRYERLKTSHRACQCCGAVGGSQKKVGAGLVVIHVDHIKPKNIYPELCLTLRNTQVLCEDCNLGKGSVDETDWRVK